jgi:hypothetical protein
LDLTGLNRAERQLHKKYTRGEKFMKVNLLHKIEAFDADGKVVRNRSEQVPDLKEVILIALRQPLQADQATGLKEKNERYLLIKRLTASDEVDLADSEIKLINERVGRVHLQVEIVGRVMELLSGEASKPVPPEPPPSNNPPESSLISLPGEVKS